ncbi:N-acylneuraminate cytidylyltransferase isoform X1 [Penaeus vannamei]|uniref:N-acylneuraminate cytidylyltransferase isoform X1 n=1 Tax=Penaeus vannamei TaxID=6689 RepID=UPI00387F66B6
MHITGLVLARGGSKGIKNKNLALLDNQPLLLRTLGVMHEAKCFSSIWVSTDSEKIAECAREGGANVHWRAGFTATDDAPSLVAVQEFVQYHPDTEVVCLVQCTSPFMKPCYIQWGLQKIRSGYDSVFSVTRKHYLRWAEGEETFPQNFDPHQRPSRQKWPGELYENGMFYYTRVGLLKQGLLQGGRCGYVEIPPENSMDIDTPLDLIIAEQLINYCDKKQT